MAYVNMFATVKDELGGGGQTLSCRGQVNHVSAWINTALGSAVRVSADYYDGSGSVPKPDLRSIPKGEARDKAKKEYDDAVHKSTSVTVNINPDFGNDQIEFVFAGIRITGAEMKLLEDMHKREFLGTLSIASAFAMIPDIVRMTNDPSDENKQTFIDKRDKITAFIASEEAKLAAI